MAKKNMKVDAKPTILSLYVVRVTKASAVPHYGPFVSLSDDMALTSFAELAKSEPMLERSYLYKVGTFDPVSGALKSCRKTLVVAKSPVCGLKKVRKGTKNEEVQNAI